MSDGQQLLAEYADAGSEDAFRELVARYVDLVYSAAVRLVNNDRHLAEGCHANRLHRPRPQGPHPFPRGDARRLAASHTPALSPATPCAAKRRRRLREQQAVEIEFHHRPTPQLNSPRFAPILDDAINQLGAEDRTAIILRFFEQRDFRSVGEALGSNEEAARKRVNRALDKLQLLLKHRGVALSATALGAALASQAVTAAPAGLAAASPPPLSPASLPATPTT